MKVYLKGLTCANCAGKIETAVNALSETRQAEINLVNQTMEVSLSEGTEELGVLQKIEKIVHKFEPDVVVAMDNSKAVETASCSCSHCHESSREHEDSPALEDDHGHDHGNGEEGEGKKF